MYIYTCVGASVHTGGCDRERLRCPVPDHMHTATENLRHIRSTHTHDVVMTQTLDRLLYM